MVRLLAVASSPTTAAVTTDNNMTVEKKTEEQDYRRQHQLHQQQQQLQQTTSDVLGSLRGWTTKNCKRQKKLTMRHNVLLKKNRRVYVKRHRLSSMADVIVALGGDNDDGYYTHDNYLALDIESLRDAEVVYITDCIISMSHPALQSTSNGDITPQRKTYAT